MEHASPGAVALTILFLAPVLYSISRAKKGREIFIRRIPGIDAIDNAVGRSVELGRPISFTTGLTGVGPLFYACLSALRHVAQKAAVFNAKLVVPSSDPEAMALTDATLQNAYRDAKRSHLYDPTIVRYLSSEQFAFSSGYMGTIHRENVGSAFLFGSFAAESLILAEAGQQIGALQVAATPSLEQTPFFLTACDYTLIGDEIYATGAFLSNDPVQRGSLQGQDYAKMALIAILVLSLTVATFFSAFSDGSGEEAAQRAKPRNIFSQFMSARWSDLLPKKE